MQTVNLNIGGTYFQLACDEGEEDHLIRLASELDRRVDAVSRRAAGAGDNTRFMMAGIMLVDELFELRKELNSLKSEQNTLSDGRIAELADQKIGNCLNEINSRMEKIANELQKIYNESR